MSRKSYSVTNCLGSSFYIGSPYLQKNYHLATFCEFTKILAILSDSALPGIALNRLLNSSELPFYFSLTGAALSEMIVFVYVPTFMLTVLYSVNTVRIVHRCKKNSIWIPLLPQQDICLPAGGQTKNIFTELSFSFPLFALQIDA